VYIHFNYANYGIFFYIPVFFVDYLTIKNTKSEKIDRIFIKIGAGRGKKRI